MKDDSSVTAFAERLNKACVDCPKLPEFGKGLQVELAKAMEVSQESARKWLAGLSRPSPRKMVTLAEYLGVDAAWLAMGITPIMNPEEQKSFHRTAEGAVYVAYGHYMMDGYACGFPDDNDLEAIDFTVIKQGTVQHVHVSGGVELEPNNFMFNLPAEHGKLKCLGVVPRSFGHCDILSISENLVQQHGDKKGDSYTLAMKRSGEKYKIGKTVVPVINSPD